MYEMPHRFGPADAKGRVFSPVQHRMVKLTPAMVKAVEILDRFGYVSVGGGVKVATAVALKDRGILREAKSHGSRHYPATTREQVHGAAIIEHGLRICDKIDAEEAAGVDTWVDPEDGDGPMFIGAASGALVNPGAAPAHVEADPLPWHAQVIKDALVNPGAAPEACPVHGGRSHRACESYPAPCAPVEHGPIDKAAILRRRPNIDSLMNSGAVEVETTLAAVTDRYDLSEVTCPACGETVKVAWPDELRPHSTPLGEPCLGDRYSRCESRYQGLRCQRAPHEGGRHLRRPTRNSGLSAWNDDEVKPIAPAETRTDVSDVSDVSASIADEVAALRAEIHAVTSGLVLGVLPTERDMLARLDRIVR